MSENKTRKYVVGLKDLGTKADSKNFKNIQGNLHPEKSVKQFNTDVIN